MLYEELKMSNKDLEVLKFVYPSLRTDYYYSSFNSILNVQDNSIAKELINITVNGKDTVDELDEMEVDHDEHDWKAQVSFTSANYQAKKTVFLLFINR